MRSSASPRDTNQKGPVSKIAQTDPDKTCKFAAGRWNRPGEIMATLKSEHKAEQYVNYAIHCLNMAKLAANREARVIQREMAAEWLKLAALFSAGHQESKTAEPAE
jgi:hypothetical protein